MTGGGGGGDLRPSDRDLAVINLIQRLQHVTSHHVHELVFSNHTSSRTPCARSLARLTKLGYIDRTEKRPLGGSRGGSAYYIYRLGRRGHFLSSDEPYHARRQPVEHSLAVADVVVILRQLERGGLVLNAVQTEPDCHVSIGRTDLKPDLFVDLVHPTVGRLMLWCEMDMATQGKRRIVSKFGLYLRAVHKATDDELEAWGGVLPSVLFIAVDAERKRELNYLLQQVPQEDRSIFRVTTREELPRILFR